MFYFIEWLTGLEGGDVTICVKTLTRGLYVQRKFQCAQAFLRVLANTEDDSENRGKYKTYTREALYSEVVVRFFWKTFH